jgi:hypothetical protein
VGLPSSTPKSGAFCILNLWSIITPSKHVCFQYVTQQFCNYMSKELKIIWFGTDLFP